MPLPQRIHRAFAHLSLCRAGGVAIMLAAAMLLATSTRASVTVTNTLSADGPVRAILRHGGKVYVAGDFKRLSPAQGAWVPTSAATGAPAGAFPKVAGEVYASCSDGAGGWYIGGNFTHVGGVSHKNLARVLANGTVSSWDPAIDGVVRALLLNGTTVYVGGSILSIGGQPRTSVAALNASTGALLAWNPEAGSATPSVSLVTAMCVGSGALYVGGTFSEIGGGTLRENAAALDLVTAAVRPWAPNPNSTVTSLAFSGSSVFIGGLFNDVGGTPRSFLAAVNASTGAVLAGWNPSPDQLVWSLLVTGSRLYVGGGFSTIGAQSRPGLAALDPATGAVQAWTPDPAPEAVVSLALSGNTLYCDSGAIDADATQQSQVRAYDTTTGVRTAWNPRASGGLVYTIQAGPSTVWIGGTCGTIGGADRNGLAAIDPTTGTVLPWNPMSLGTFIAPKFRALAAHGAEIIAGGTFFNFQSLAFHSNLGAFDTTTGVMRNWFPDPDLAVNSLALRGDTLYVAGGFSTLGGQARENLGAVSLASGTALPWVANTDFDVDVLALAGRNLYAGGNFTQVALQPHTGLVALDASTGSVRPYALDTDGRVGALHLAGSTLYVGGAFEQFGGVARDHLAAVDPATGTRLAFSPTVPLLHPTTVSVDAIALAQGLVYVAGFLGSHPEARLDGAWAFEPIGAVVPSWNPRLFEDPQHFSLYPLEYVLTLVPDGTRIWLGGWFEAIEGQPSYHLAQVTTSPTVDVVPGLAGPALELAAPDPNPARDAATLTFTLPGPAAVTVDLFDVAGRRVRAIATERSQPAGRSRLPFATVDDAGVPLRSGLYFVRVTAAGRSLSQRLVIAR